MNKYLWNLKIETISLAWDNLYRDATENYPKGTMIEMDSNPDEEIFADPITCRKLLIENFNTYSNNAKKLFTSLENSFDKSKLNQLIQIDAIIYTILSYWLDDLLGLDAMDPMFFMEELIESSMDHYLYTLTNPNPMLLMIDDYRLIKI